MSPVEACAIHHTVKQLTITLNALLASAESAFGARVSAALNAAVNLDNVKESVWLYMWF